MLGSVLGAHLSQMLTLPAPFLNRRSLLTGAGSLFATPVCAGETVSPAEQILASRIKDPVEALRLYIKLNADASGKPVYGWFSGHVYAINQGQITTPLFGIEGYGMGWSAPQAGGSFRQIWKEVGFYKDLKSGAILETWQNPLNKAACEVMHIHNRSVNVTMVPVGQPVSFPGMDIAVGGDLTEPSGGMQPFSVPWFVNGDTVACTMDTRLSGPQPLSPKEWPRESSGDRHSVTEFLMHYASLKQLLDPRVTNVAAVAHWTRICAWLPWMLMGQAPGEIIYRSVSKKLVRFEDIPEHLRAYSKAHFPEFLELSTPEEQKMPPESSFEVFKATRRPSPV